MRTGLKFERAVGFPDAPVIGVDEVGRGCLAGPVVAGAVLLPWGSAAAELNAKRRPKALRWVSDVTDSKLLDREERDRLAPLIREWLASVGAAWGVASASVEEIDTINIYHASHLAMARSLEAVLGDLQMQGRALSERSATLLIDGNAVPAAFKGARAPVCVAEVRPIVKGDLQCFSIACASILAKVWRDDHMREIDSLYPGYGFASHKGYSTPEHKEALARLGALALHRRSFAPVQEALGLLAPTAIGGAGAAGDALLARSEPSLFDSTILDPILRADS